MEESFGIVFEETLEQISLTEIEQSTGARIAYVTRFGLGELPTSSMLLQDGDVLHVMVTDEQRARLPEGWTRRQCF